MDNQDLNLYIKELINFSLTPINILTDLEPWSLKKTNPERMNTVLYNILNQIRSISILLHPIIPDSTNKALDILGIKKEDRVIR
jgi:methionyl-tRNA synthetase